MVSHFKQILCEYHCPEIMTQTIQSVFDDEKFKNIIKFYVNEQIKYQLNLTHCDSSTNSNESFGSCLNTSQINFQEINFNQ